MAAGISSAAAIISPGLLLRPKQGIIGDLTAGARRLGVVWGDWCLIRSPVIAGVVA